MAEDMTNGMRGGVKLDHLAGDLSFVSRMLRTRIMDANAPLFEKHNIASGEVAVLNLIGINPGLTQKDLSQAVILKKSALTKLVNELERAGLIERRKEGGDMRLNALYLTEKGSQRVAGMTPDIREMQDRLMAPLSPGERAMLFELLWRLIDGQDAGAPSGR